MYANDGKLGRAYEFVSLVQSLGDLAMCLSTRRFWSVLPSNAWRVMTFLSNRQQKMNFTIFVEGDLIGFVMGFAESDGDAGRPAFWPLIV